ncbi:MAG: hypothetical protein HC895_03015 [Leptolyngbyaceae cyanobacterium SM1_3_5]|nr:hypothetical protein [Leptolyngbyaceae cyanobacterium SM1_3_5]
MSLKFTVGLALGLLTALTTEAIAYTALIQKPMHFAQATDRDQITRLVLQSLREGGGTAQAEVFALRIVGNDALASWMYGETGGQTLLRRDES